MPLVWLAISLAFVVGEVLSLAFYALFPAVGALAAAVAAAFGVSFEGQVIVFAAVSILGVVAARPPMMHYLRRRQEPEMKSGAEEMIGKEAPVVEDIVDAHHPGHVRITGENWPALSEHGEPILKGSTVRVTALKQATLIVTQVHEAPQNASHAGTPAPSEG